MSEQQSQGNVLIIFYYSTVLETDKITVLLRSPLMQQKLRVEDQQHRERGQPRAHLEQVEAAVDRGAPEQSVQHRCHRATTEQHSYNDDVASFSCNCISSSLRLVARG